MAAEKEIRNRPRGQEIEVLQEDLDLGFNLGSVRKDEDGRLWVPWSDVAEGLVGSRTQFGAVRVSTVQEAIDVAGMLNVREYMITEDMASRAMPYLDPATPAAQRNRFLAALALEVRRSMAGMYAGL